MIRLLETTTTIQLSRWEFHVLYKLLGNLSQHTLRETADLSADEAVTAQRMYHEIKSQLSDIEANKS